MKLIKSVVKFFVVLTLLNYSCQKTESISSSDSEILDTLQVRLTYDIKLNWSNKSQRFIKDSLYQNAIENFDREKFEILEMVQYTDELQARVCGLEGRMVLGDMAFIFMDDVEKFPHNYLFSTRYDFRMDTCFYSKGFLRYISENRQKSIDQIREYFKWKDYFKRVYNLQ